MRFIIPLKLPSLNDYINKCRYNKYAAAEFKKQTQEYIQFYLYSMPKFEEPIYLHFTWIEKNKKRDLDNIASAKKYILDTMVSLGKIPNDNSQYVKGFSDTFEYESEYRVIIDITKASEKELVQDIDVKGLLVDINKCIDNLSDFDLFNSRMIDYKEVELLKGLAQKEKRQVMKKAQDTYSILMKLQKYLQRRT